MWQGIGIYVTLMVVCLANVQAAVIRPEEQQEMTTPRAMEATESIEAMEDASTTVEPMESTTVAVAVTALSRDKDASVQIKERETLASLDPAPGTIEGDLSVRLDDKPQKQQQQKSAKLLLLSTPAKRPTAEVEQQLEEQDESESAAAGSGEANVATTTQEQEHEQLDNTTTESTAATIDHKAATTTTEATTKLFAIDATTSSKDSSEPNIAVAVATDNATISIAEQPQPVGNNNVAIELALTEPEADYVLLDGTDLELASVTHDDLQLGSFTHIDSDAHLQPVVHSVEIVPTRFDDPLIVNYVHNFR